MGDRTEIAWTDATWNPLRGCSRVSEGCRNCYAERMAARGLPGLNSPTTGEPFAIMTPQGPRWTGKVELIESQLDVPLRWRTPRRIFVNSMSDTFHESIRDEWIGNIVGTIWATPRHQFQVLTKRPQRAAEYLPRLYAKWNKQDLDAETAADCAGRSFERGPDLPPENLWLGVSVEDQRSADKRIPHLLATPAAVRFLSVEPLLGPVDLKRWLRWPTDSFGIPYPGNPNRIDWVVVGGESGPGARPCRLEWIRSIVQQCAAAGVPCFVKQIGSRPEFASDHWPEGLTSALWSSDLGFYDYPATKKGGDPTEWPDDLRVRQFPEARNA